jgi:hypothetical protein
MNTVSTILVTLVFLSVIAAYLYDVFRALIWATAKDISKNLDIDIKQNLNANAIHAFNNTQITFNAQNIAQLKTEQNKIYDGLIQESNQYDDDIDKKDKQEKKTKRAKTRQKHESMAKKHGVNRSHLDSSSTKFAQSAANVNKKLTEKKSKIHKVLSRLDFALDWPILDIAAKKIFVKVLKNQMNEILSDLAKIDKLNFTNDCERLQTIELFQTINAKLAIIKFALEIANSRSIKEISSNAELKKSINDIYNDLSVKAARPYKMQMTSYEGNLIKAEKSSLNQFQTDTQSKFLPIFQDSKSKPKNIEINRCLAIASTFEAVHELKGKFV